MSLKKNKFILLLIVIFGLIIGAFISELVASLLPAGVVRDVLTIAVQPSFGPLTFDLLAVKFTLGVGFRINLCSIFGLGIAAYIFKWY